MLHLQLLVKRVYLLYGLSLSLKKKIVKASTEKLSTRAALIKLFTSLEDYLGLSFYPYD